MKAEYKHLSMQLGSESGFRLWPLGLGAVLLTAFFLYQNLNQDPGYVSIDESALYSSPTEDVATSDPLALFSEPREVESLPQARAPIEMPSMPLSPPQHIAVASGDTLNGIFLKLGLSHRQLQEFIKSDRLAMRFTQLKPGQILKYQISDQELQSLSLELALGHELIAERQASGFRLEQVKKPLKSRLNYASGVITSSLNLSAKLAGLDRKLTAQIVDIFGWDINFAQDIRQNDQFKVLFEEQHIDGKKIATGDILAIEFINQGKRHQAVRYTDKQGFTGYYSTEGNSLQKAFIRTPLKYTRISSHFGHRRHPILQTVRHHKGVDYAAPTGTPIKAMGNAKVIFAGTKRGYGKVIILQHGPKYRTLYAHLSRFAKELKLGAKVIQGQIIGYVGTTGMTSGAHLHLEFLVNGVHQDPLKVPLPKASAIESTQRLDFQAHAEKMIQLLHNEPLRLASNP